VIFTWIYIFQVISQLVSDLEAPWNVKCCCLLHKHYFYARIVPGYNDIGLCDTSFVASGILWHQLVPHLKHNIKRYSVIKTLVYNDTKCFLCRYNRVRLYFDSCSDIWPVILAGLNHRTTSWNKNIPVIRWYKKVGIVHRCTGRTVHRGSRCIALPFHDYGTRRSEGSASHPGRSLSPGKTRYPLYRRLDGPQDRSGQVRKISPPPGIEV
jgi:hypothetical protein